MLKIDRCTTNHHRLARCVQFQARGGVPNMEASMNKMYGSELQQRVALT